MDRREAIKNVAIMMGSALSAGTLSAIIESCNRPEKKRKSDLFTADQQTLITEICEAILPKTDTPGAKEAGVGPFIAMMVQDCYPILAQKIFIDGLNNINQRSKTSYKKDFIHLSTTEKNRILTAVRDQTVVEMRKDEAKEQVKDDLKEPKVYFFATIRDLTLLGFNTSELGATKAFRYVEIPGRYDGCVDLKPGQKLWA